MPFSYVIINFSWLFAHSPICNLIIFELCLGSTGHTLSKGYIKNLKSTVLGKEVEALNDVLIFIILYDINTLIYMHYIYIYNTFIITIK